MKLPEYVEQARPTIGAAAARVDPASIVGNTAGALQGATNALLNITADAAERARIQEEKRARVQAASLSAELRGTWTANLAKAQAEAPEDPSGFADGVLAKYDEDIKSRLAAAPENVRELLSARAADLRADIQGRAVGFEAVRQTEAQKAALFRTIGSHANTLRTDETQYDTVWGEVEDAIKSSSVKDKDGAIRDAKRQLAVATLQGLNERAPERAAKLLAGGAYDDVLTADEKNALVNDNNSEIRRLENERKAAEAERRRQWEHSLSVRRASLSEVLKDDEQRIADGLAPRATPAEIRAAYADMPETATRILRNRDLLGETAGARKELLAAAPDKEEEILARFAPKPTEDGYAVRKEAHDLLVRSQKAKHEALGKDPAGYALSLSPELADARKAAFEGANGQDGGKGLSTYLKASLDMQEKLGVPKSRQSPLADADAVFIVERFKSAETPQAKLDVLLPVTVGLGDDALARRAAASLKAAKLPEGALYALDVARDPSRRNTARQLLAELSTPAERVTLSDADGKSMQKNAARAYEDGLGSVLMKAYQVTGNSGYRDRFAADQKTVEHVTRMRLGSVDDPAAAAYRDLFGHVGTVDVDGLAHVWFDAAKASEGDVSRGFAVLRETAAEALKAEGEKLLAAELASMADKSPGERAGHEKLRRRQLEDSLRDLKRRGTWVNQGDGYALIVPGAGAAVGRRFGLDDILGAAKDKAGKIARDEASDNAWILAASPGGVR